MKKRVEDFKCEKCEASVIGNGYTNHCPACLWSKHVDMVPGDRAASCLGMMEPVELLKEGDEFVIVHRCLICQTEKRNKTATTCLPAGRNDDVEGFLQAML